MRRFIPTLQVVLGLVLLFGGGWLAVERIVGPTAAGESEQLATANARVAASELAIAWDSLRQRQRIAVRALATTSVLSTLGSEFPEGPQRSRAMDRALAAATAQVGGTGVAAVFGKNRELIAGDSAAASYAKLPSTIAALDGATSTRLETIAKQVMLVTATPLGDDAAALLIATPLDMQRIRKMVPSLPSATSVVLVAGESAVAGTLRPDQMGSFDPSKAAATLSIGPAKYASHPMPLKHDSATSIRAIGLAQIAPGASATAIPQIRLLVLAMGGIALLLVLIVGGLAPAPAPAAAAEKTAPAAEAPPPPTAPMPVELPTTAPAEPAMPSAISMAPRPTSEPSEPVIPAAPPTPDIPVTPQPPPPEPPPPKLDFPSAPGLSTPPPGAVPSAFSATPSPPPSPGLEAQFAQKTVPAGRAPSNPVAPPNAASERSDPFGSPVPPITGIPKSTPPPQAAPMPPPQAAPMPPPQAAPAPPAPPAPPPSAFDAIANAARTPAPPSAISLRGPADLPVPKEGLPPELIAAQRAEAARQKAEKPAAPPPPSPTHYDSELVKPKAEEAIPLPGSNAASMIPEAPTQPTPLAPSATPPPAPPRSNPWQAPGMKGIDPGTGPTGTIRGASAKAQGLTNALPPAPAPGSAIPLPASNAPSAPPSSGMVGMEPFDEAHYRLVYNEFVSSKAKLGEAVDNITYEGFRTKLRTSEQALLDRHGCKAVRFQVLVKDRTVSLRPQLVR